MNCPALRALMACAREPEVRPSHSELGQGAPAQYPLYSRDVHQPRASIHADGLSKFWPMHTPCDVPCQLGRPLDLSLTQDSRLAGLIFLIRQHTGAELAKNYTSLRNLYEQLSAELDASRQAAVESGEIKAQARALV